MNMPPAREPIPDLPVRESSVSKPESGVFSLLTVVTLSLHVALAFRVAAYYGTERAENFWWLLVLSLIVHLVGIVFLVSRVSAQQTAAGYNLKKKLDEDQQTSSGLLLVSVVVPEVLHCLVAEHEMAIITIDTFAACPEVAGVPSAPPPFPPPPSAPGTSFGDD